MNVKRQHPRWISIALALVVVAIVSWEMSSRIQTSWYVALFAGIATYIIAVETVDWWRDRDRETFTYQPPTAREFLAHYEELQQYAETLGPIRPGMVEAAEFLLDEAKGDFDRVSGSSDSHEEKARAVLGIVAGATGALGVFGVSKDGQTIIPTPIIIDALIFVLVGFVCLLYVLRVKHYKRPDLGTYFAGAMGPRAPTGRTAAFTDACVREDDGRARAPHPARAQGHLHSVRSYGERGRLGAPQCNHAPIKRSTAPWDVAVSSRSASSESCRSAKPRATRASHTSASRQPSIKTDGCNSGMGTGSRGAKMVGMIERIKRDHAAGSDSSVDVDDTSRPGPFTPPPMPPMVEVVR